MKKIDLIKNIIIAVIVVAVCSTAIGAIGSFSEITDTYEESDALFIGGILICIRLMLVFVAVLAVVNAIQNSFLIYADNDGMEKHRTGLIAFGVMKQVSEFLIQLSFFSIFFYVGFKLADPAFTQNEHIQTGSNMSVFGWIFILASAGVTLFAVIKLIKGIKRVKLSYTFDNIDMSDKDVEVLPQNETFKDDSNSPYM